MFNGKGISQTKVHANLFRHAMSLTHFHDTIAAASTAEGRAALGIVRISGTDAIQIVAKIVSEPENLLVARGGSSIYTNVAQTLVCDLSKRNRKLKFALH